MKCSDCGQDILQSHPEMCPYCRSKNLITEEDNSSEIEKAEQLLKDRKYEEAALTYEKLDLWGQAKECRRTASKKHAGVQKLETAKVGAVSMICPHCGEVSEPINVDSKVEICSHCGTSYLVPNSVLALLNFVREH